MNSDLSHCTTFSPASGWDTINGYILVRGRIEGGCRRKSRRLINAERIIEQTESCAPGWPSHRLRKPSTNAYRGIGEKAHPVKGAWGLATELVALADEMFGSAGWRVGPLNAEPSLPFVAAKIKDAKVVAILAPCRVDGI